MIEVVKRFKFYVLADFLVEFAAKAFAAKAAFSAMNSKLPSDYYYVDLALVAGIGCLIRWSTFLSIFTIVCKYTRRPATRFKAVILVLPTLFVALLFTSALYLTILGPRPQFGLVALGGIIAYRMLREPVKATNNDLSKGIDALDN